VREHWHDPWRIYEAGKAALAKAREAASPIQPADTAWIPALSERARQIMALYDDAHRPDYALFQASVAREQARLKTAEEEEHFLRLK